MKRTSKLKNRRGTWETIDEIEHIKKLGQGKHSSQKYNKNIMLKKYLKAFKTRDRFGKFNNKKIICFVVAEINNSLTPQTRSDIY